ncbi:CDP-alcohol phosphatidyltransferase family protein [Lentisphaerota bacterium ZTH]|nr:CDP-alcohol phosphatidyltransferase family protein [Lentisphaerota bacterium]WET07584.1 CDP-alcohol phosphatidyltransferase family protein [Lentisphaerota bacterium ZTH]
MKNRFRTLLEENRWFKSVPNALTLCNSLCGFTAMLLTLQVYHSPKGVMEVFALSAWVILFAMIFDALDGFAARIFNAASMKGIQMDSLADMVTFGVAPAIICAILAHCGKQMNIWQTVITYGFCGVYLGCAALRLATYNVHAMVEKKSGDKFSGLPSPGGAAAICSVVILCKTYSAPIKYLEFGLPIYAAILGLLMVSNVSYIHIGKWLFSIRRNKKRLAVFLIILLAVGAFKIAAVVALINLYIFSGPVIALFGKIKSITGGGANRQNQTA